MQKMEDVLRFLSGPNLYTSTSFEDLCFYPDMVMPSKFKLPDFSKYNCTEEPMTHMRLYAGALCGHANPEKLMMHLFQHSLTGATAQWFA